MLMEMYVRVGAFNPQSSVIVCIKEFGKKPSDSRCFQESGWAVKQTEPLTHGRRGAYEPNIGANHI